MDQKDIEIADISVQPTAVPDHFLQGESNVEDRAPHPMIGSLLGSRILATEVPQIDTLDELYDREKYYRAVRFIRLQYTQPNLTPLQRALASLYEPMHAVEGIGNQFATKVIPCYMQEDAGEALQAFRSIRANTTKEESVLLTNDEQFKTMHAALGEHLIETEDDMRQAASEHLQDIKKADKYQFSNTTERSLENMLRNGMTITIDETNAEEIKKAGKVAGEGILPVTEYLKNEKILGVSGFMGSKISLAVHDFMDHMWTFAMIEEAGLLDKYSDMFDSIGNPEATDIFKREGETIASIAFGVRYFQTMPSAFGPIFRSSQIESHFENMFVNGQLSERHMQAFQNIKKLLRGSMEWQSLGFVFSNYITEVDEQRRKHGKIKQRDPRTRHVLGELDPFSADYMSFFVEAHREVLSPKNKHRDDLFRFHILLEEYLSSYAKGELPKDEPLTLKLDELRKLDFTKTTLPPQRIQWMAANYGFTATRDAII